MRDSEIRSQAETLLREKISALQIHISSIFAGREKEAVIEVFRALDLMFVSMLLAPRVDEDSRLRAYYARCGVPEALMPLLDKAHGCPRGVPWGESHPRIGSLIKHYLEELGKLVDLIRLVRISAQGVATVEVSGRSIQIATFTDKRERVARHLLRTSAVQPAANCDLPTEAVRARMRRYVCHDDAYHIAYENDPEIVSQHLHLAERFRSRFPESEAIPDNSIIAGRPFSAWRADCEQALGRVLAHINFSLLLCHDRSATSLKNVLTMFCTRADAVELATEAGGAESASQQTLNALTLEPDDLEEWARLYELPTVQYVSLDSEFLLIPCFGMLGNPYHAMFRHLRRFHRRDWDKAVDAREVVFRADLALLFKSPRYLVPEHGYKLKRGDGSHITDIDAVVLDRTTGSVALVQLKWHDPYGRSISERESRRKNLAKATDWVENVNEWVAGRSCAEICCALQLPASSSPRTPKIFVLSRYAATFACDDRENSTATWLSWPELKHVMQYEADDPIQYIAESFEDALAESAEDEVVPFSQSFQFGDLSVTLHAGRLDE